ncbi:SAM hydrolase/SAM-dependent halogenase family protein [Chryseolinea sp. T2]|uniref:SAM hydrolase/SAM-dependent halogenase family protein n=1 Tax=Chryseolinea sp. T2 TaxID=3129255 RepID=UPI00307839F2
MHIISRPRFQSFVLLFLFLTTALSAQAQRRALVFQSDFGLKDAAVGAMKGVAFGVSSDIAIFDLTHEIPAFDIWEASYRLGQAAAYWPKGTVFVSIIDPGVGSSRRSVVARTKTGHFIVTPDNGTLTHVAESLGIDEVREIDEAKNRLTNSNESYTFHGRDVYAYTGARLASGTIAFEEVGPAYTGGVVLISYQKATFSSGEVIGGIPVLDIQYGNVWTNVDKTTFSKLGAGTGDWLQVKIVHKGKVVYNERVKFVETFATVEKGKDLGYLNSLLNFSLAINLGNFSQTHQVFSGSDWTISIKKSQ